MPLSAGDKLGPYELLSPIGEGGMGEVWRACDTRLERTVAIKFLKQEFTERFEREARAIAALNHPNICQLYDVGPNYLVMEYIEGTTLQGPLKVEQAVEYAGQILDALGAAHRKGITHRDLKPANVLVTKQGIKLLDFGLAKQAVVLKDLNETRTKTLTATGEIAGTLQYMAPEQLQGKEADPRSDLFAFGCVMYELLSGERAFKGSSAASVIAAILEREPAPLQLSPPLDRVIRRCLAKDPDGRFQTASDLKYAVLSAQAEQPFEKAATKVKGWYWPAAAIFSLGLLGGWDLARTGQIKPDLQAIRSQLNPPEGGQFDGGSLALSPDGRTLAFSATVEGKTGLWVRPIDGTVSRQLPDTDGAAFPFWSPDGASLGYFSGEKLWRVDVAGGSPSSICDSTESRGGAWTSDGSMIFGQRVGPLRRVSAVGGAAADLTILDEGRREITHRWPQILPGGRFLCLSRKRQAGKSEIVLGRLSKPNERVSLIETEGNAVYVGEQLFWLRGTTLVAQHFDVERLNLSGEVHPIGDPVGFLSRTGRVSSTVSSSGVMLYSTAALTNQFIWVDRTGRVLGNMGNPGAYSYFNIAQDGRRLAVTRSDGHGLDVWLADMDRNLWNRFTFNGSSASGPVWSPDGNVVAFSHAQGVFQKETNGPGLQEQVLERGRLLDWSRDGHHLLIGDDQRSTTLSTLRMSSGKSYPGAKPVPYLRSQAQLSSAKFSPGDPHWIAYVSDENGQDQVFIQAFPKPQGKWQVSTSGGRFPEWAPDGSELFYLAPDNKLMAVRLKLAKDFVEPSTPQELFPIAWDSSPSGSPYAIAPDGKRFLVRTVKTAGSPLLQVISHWPALLKKPTQ